MPSHSPGSRLPVGSCEGLGEALQPRGLGLARGTRVGEGNLVVLAEVSQPGTESEVTLLFVSGFCSVAASRRPGFLSVGFGGMQLIPEFVPDWATFHHH